MPDRPARNDEWRFTGEGCRSNARLRVAALAARQFGRVRYDQVRALGVSGRTLGRWADDGYLHRLLPRVYAVGHLGRSTEGDLAAALLYAGPGAMLSHGTGVWWLELLQYPPREMVVSTPRRIQGRDNIVVHGRRRLGRIWHNGLPVTMPSQAILDFAATGKPEHLRLVLANADYRGLLDVNGLLRISGRGIDGSAALREALSVHLPQLAHTRSELEILLLWLCEQYGLPMPEVNVYVLGWLVDALWPGRRVIVEVDGWRGHRTRAQLENDHRRDLELRAAGYLVLRYTWRQLTETPAAVAAELSRFL